MRSVAENRRGMVYLIVIALVVYSDLTLALTYCGTYADCDDDDQCVDNQCQSQYIATTTTTTVGPELGCCAASTSSTDYERSKERCPEKGDSETCDRSDGCFWIYGEYADCEYIATTTTSTTTTTTTTKGPELGCCGASISSSDYERSKERCPEKADSEACERSDGCVWIHGEYADCEYIATTTTSTTSTTTTKGPELGCCGASISSTDYERSKERCPNNIDSEICERSDGCVWIHGEYANCEYTTTTSTTTTKGPEVGCCGASTSSSDYERSKERCPENNDSVICERSDGCAWIHGEYADCEYTTTTTTEAPELGCCASNSSSDDDGSNERCRAKDGSEQCDRSDECIWIHGEYADCGVPGCCSMNPNASLTIECCMGLENERDCMALTRGASEHLCSWMETDNADRDCFGVTTTEGPGCCQMRAGASIALGCCSEMDSRMECEGITGTSDRLCEWRSADASGECGDDEVTTTDEPSDGGGAYADVRGCCVADPSTDCEDTAWYYVCGSQKDEGACVATVDGEGTPCGWAGVQIEPESVAFDYSLGTGDIYDSNNCYLKNALFFSSFFCL